MHFLHVLFRWRGRFDQANFLAAVAFIITLDKTIWLLGRIILEYGSNFGAAAGVMTLVILGAAYASKAAVIWSLHMTMIKRLRDMRRWPAFALPPIILFVAVVVMFRVMPGAPSLIELLMTVATLIKGEVRFGDLSSAYVSILVVLSAMIVTTGFLAVWLTFAPSSKNSSGESVVLFPGDRAPAGTSGERANSGLLATVLRGPFNRTIFWGALALITAMQFIIGAARLYYFPLISEYGYHAEVFEALIVAALMTIMFAYRQRDIGTHGFIAWTISFALVALMLSPLILKRLFVSAGAPFVGAVNASLMLQLSSHLMIIWPIIILGAIWVLGLWPGRDADASFKPIDSGLNAQPATAASSSGRPTFHSGFRKSHSRSFPTGKTSPP